MTCYFEGKMDKDNTLRLLPLILKVSLQKQWKTNFLGEYNRKIKHYVKN